MLRFAAVLVAALALASCDAINTMTDGFKNASAVGSDLERRLGAKPEVGFNWNNGRLLQVTVIFPRLLDRPMTELAEAVRGAVGSNFKQKPGKIVLGFTLDEASLGRTAKAR
jgi:hypothetical protein